MVKIRVMAKFWLQKSYQCYDTVFHPENDHRIPRKGMASQIPIWFMTVTETGNLTDDHKIVSGTDFLLFPSIVSEFSL